MVDVSHLQWLSGENDLTYNGCRVTISLQWLSTISLQWLSGEY